MAMGLPNPKRLIAGFGHPGDYLRGKYLQGFGPIAAWDWLPGTFSAIPRFWTAFDV
jgi:hypothetical protein